MKKQSLAAVALTIGALALTACGGSANSSSSSDASAFGDCKVTGQPDSIKLKTQKPDVLTVAVVLPNPGWSNGTSPDTVKSGFEYCMAADIAHRAGLKSVQLKNFAWDQFISGTASGYDIGLATVTITDKRKEVFDFSQRYFSSNLGIAPRRIQRSPRTPSVTQRSPFCRATLAHSGWRTCSSPPSRPQSFSPPRISSQPSMPGRSTQLLQTQRSL